MAFYDVHPTNLRNFSVYGGPNYLNLATPIGSVTCFAGTGSPFGYLLCDGSAVDREQYSALFSVIGVIYGSGDGTGTFNLPDLQSRIPVGRNHSQSPFTALAMTGGEITHTLTVGEMPAHSHTSNANGAQSIGGSGYGLAYSNGQNTYSGATDVTAGEPNLFQTVAALTINSTGASQPHNNLQPYIVLNYIIKY